MSIELYHCLIDGKYLEMASSAKYWQLLHLIIRCIDIIRRHSFDLFSMEQQFLS